MKNQKDQINDKTLEEGMKAPLFSLKNQRGESCSLSLHSGQWVVVYFYPKALTPGCIVQACGMRDSLSLLKSKNIHIFGISPDPIEKLISFEKKYSLNFDLLSDSTCEVSQCYQSYGVKKFMGKLYNGVLRKTFIINPEGMIEKIFDKVKTKTHHNDVISFFQRLTQY